MGPFMVPRQMSPEVVVLKSCIGISALCRRPENHGIFAQSVPCFFVLSLKAVSRFGDLNEVKIRQEKCFRVLRSAFVSPQWGKTGTRIFPHFEPLGLGSRVQNEVDNLPQEPVQPNFPQFPSKMSILGGIISLRSTRLQ